jgi:hypothetical protein
MWILSGLKAQVPKGAKEKLQDLVSGRHFSALDKKSHARDIQFEFRVASYFCKCGYDVFMDTETDIIAEGPSIIFFVECKRVSSGSSLEKRICEAKAQLLKRIPPKGDKESRGFIFVDVTRIAFTHDGLGMSATGEQSQEAIRKKLKAISSRIDKSWCYEPQRRILNCIVQVHIPSLVLYPPTPITRISSTNVDNPFLKEEDDETLEMLLRTTSIGALLPDERTIAPRSLKVRRDYCPPKMVVAPNMRLLRELFSGAELENYNSETVIVTFKYEDGEEDSFVVMELASIIQYGYVNFHEREPTDEKIAAAAFKLGVAMYAQRYPYEGQGPW